MGKVYVIHRVLQLSFQRTWFALYLLAIDVDLSFLACLSVKSFSVCCQAVSSGSQALSSLWTARIQHQVEATFTSLTLSHTSTSNVTSHISSARVSSFNQKTNYRSIRNWGRRLYKISCSIDRSESSRTQDKWNRHLSDNHSQLLHNLEGKAKNHHHCPDNQLCHVCAFENLENHHFHVSRLP